MKTGPFKKYSPSNFLSFISIPSLQEEEEKRNTHISRLDYRCWDFPGGAVVKNPPANAGDIGSSPGRGSN